MNETRLCAALTAVAVTAVAQMPNTKYNIDHAWGVLIGNSEHNQHNPEYRFFFVLYCTVFHARRSLYNTIWSCLVWFGVDMLVDRFTSTLCLLDCCLWHQHRG